MSTEAPSGETKSAPPPIPAQGSPCWVEIGSRDPPKLKEFYAALFSAWKFKPATEQYKEENIVMFEFDEPKGLTGGIIKLPDTCPRASEPQPLGVGMTVYYYVESLEDTEKKVHSLGGTTALGKTREGTNGWFMNFWDLDGNRFAAYQVDWEGMGKKE